MNDSYAEVLVKRKSTPAHTAAKIGMIILTAALCLAGLWNWLLLIPGVFLLLADNFVLPMLDVEYEYLYVNGELSVDKILGKNKRKNCFEGQMDKLEAAAPMDSPKLQETAGLKCVERDFTSGKEDADIYVCIFRGEKEVTKLFLERNDKMVELMYQTAPRKVSR